MNKSYTLVECTTCDSGFVDSATILAGPFASEEEALKELDECAKLYEGDEDVTVDDGHILIDDGQNGQRTILVASY